MSGLLQRYLGKYVYGLDAESLRISVWRGDVELRNLRLKPEALEELNLPITVKSGLLGRLTLKASSSPCNDACRAWMHNACISNAVLTTGAWGRPSCSGVSCCACSAFAIPIVHPVFIMALCQLHQMHAQKARVWCYTQVPWSNLGREPVVVEFDRLYVVACPRQDDSTQGSCPDSDDGAKSAEEFERNAKETRVDKAEENWLKVSSGGSYWYSASMEHTTASGHCDSPVYRSSVACTP